MSKKLKTIINKINTEFSYDEVKIIMMECNNFINDNKLEKATNTLKTKYFADCENKKIANILNMCKVTKIDLQKADYIIRHRFTIQFGEITIYGLLDGAYDDYDSRYELNVQNMCYMNNKLGDDLNIKKIGHALGIQHDDVSEFLGYIDAVCVENQNWIYDYAD